MAPMIKVFPINRVEEISLNPGQIGICIDSTSGDIALKVGGQVTAKWNDLPVPNAADIASAVSEKSQVQIVTWGDDD